jgi:hypothetical protein
VPYPADYGGVVDLFYKIIALHAQGILIHLHCFEYGRGKQIELEKYCVEVNYYPRKSLLKSFSFKVPYIVRSRRNKILFKNLLKDEHPVLFEGIHCTYYLFHPALATRKMLVRLHNVEYLYYKNLAETATSFFKKQYFLLESKLLKQYEKKVAAKVLCITLTEDDKEIYEEQLGAKSLSYLPVFIKNEQVESKAGYGNYCIYHGNLSIRENENMVLWLINEVFHSISIPFVIAGKNPSAALTEAVIRNKNICLEANPSEHNMHDLIQNAQINVLPAQNSAGIKIKLLNAVFNGRHCLVNATAVSGTGLEEVCAIAVTPSEFIKAIEMLYKLSFIEDDILERQQILNDRYNNRKNAKALIHLIY